MLNIIPPELVLHVLSTLDLPSLRAVKLSSRSWLNFFEHHGDAIYRDAAVLHGFAGPQAGIDIEQVQNTFATDWIDDTHSWEEICRHFVQLDRSWVGRGKQPLQRELLASGPRAHRFKIVREDRVLVMTVGTAAYLAKVQAGNLLSIDIHTDEILWALPRDRVRPLAHCEYDSGFLVFDRQGNALEVWRRAADSASPLDVVRDACPDEDMLLAAQEAFRANSDSLRGVFVPHALLRVPAPAWAYHVVGTQLVVASQLGRSAFIFDVAHGRLVETLDFSATDGQDWDEIHYVDIDIVNRRVLIATNNGLYVYANTGPRGVTTLVARVPTYQPETCTIYTLREHAPGRASIFQERASYLRNAVQQASGRPGGDLFACRRCSLIISARQLEHDQNIVAAHVSPCGRHIAMLVSNALIVVRDYMEPSGPINVLQLPREAEVDYLAFDGRRIAIGMSRGLVVTNVDLDNAIWLQPASQTHEFSCIQLTGEALWYTWGRPGPGLRFPASVHYCSFGASV